MSTFNVELPSVVSVKFRDDLGTRDVNLANKGADWLVWAISFGARQSVGDGGAGKAGTEDGKAAIMKKYVKVCQQGEIPSGGGGRGGMLDDETEALHRWLNQQGGTAKGAKKDLDERLLSFCRIYVMEDQPEAEVKRLMDTKNAAELTGLATDARDEVVELIRNQETYTKMVAVIAAEKAAKTGAKLTLQAAATGLKKKTH